MRRSFLALVLVPLALAACDNPVCQPATPRDPGSWVRGRVASALGPDGKPVEAAEITLRDAAGNPIAGLPRARTDANGEYLAPRVPPGHSYVMVARYPGEGGETELKTLARPGTDPAAFHDLSPATTIVTAALTKDRQGMPGDFSAQTYARAVEQVEAGLAAGGGPDLRDAAAIEAWLAARRRENATLDTALNELSGQVARVETREKVETEARSADPDPLDALRPIY